MKKEPILICMMIILSLPCLATSVAECSDTDYGKSYNAKGSVTVTNGTTQDVCEDDSILIEASCSDNELKTVEYDCPNECLDGACIPIHGEDYISEREEFNVGEGKCHHIIQFRNANKDRGYLKLWVKDTDSTIRIYYDESDSNSEGYLAPLELDDIEYELRYDEDDNVIYLEDVDERCIVIPDDMDSVSKNKEFRVGEGKCQHLLEFKQFTVANALLLTLDNYELIKLEADTSDVNEYGYLVTLKLDGINYKLRYHKDANLIYLEDIDEPCTISRFPEEGTGVKEDEKKTACKNGCVDRYNKCLPFGTRLNNKYCDISNNFLNQKTEEDNCNNNYECVSNVCVNNKCIEPSLIRKFIEWFKRLFS